MRTVQEIKSAIEQLSLETRAELIADLCGWSDDDRDLKMKTDAAAGKFSTLNEAQTKPAAPDRPVHSLKVSTIRKDSEPGNPGVLEAS